MLWKCLFCSRLLRRLHWSKRGPARESHPHCFKKILRSRKKNTAMNLTKSTRNDYSYIIDITNWQWLCLRCRRVEITFSLRVLCSILAVLYVGHPTTGFCLELTLRIRFHCYYNIISDLFSFQAKRIRKSIDALDSVKGVRWCWGAQFGV